MSNYFPSNGSEGTMFMSRYCDNCYKESGCTILLNAMVHQKQPKQWVYGEDGDPTCTSFKSYEQRNKERKKAHVPIDKNQLKLF